MVLFLFLARLVHVQANLRVFIEGWDSVSRDTADTVQGQSAVTRQPELV